MAFHYKVRLLRLQWHYPGVILTLQMHVVWDKYISFHWALFNFCIIRVQFVSKQVILVNLTPLHLWQQSVFLNPSNIYCELDLTTTIQFTKSQPYALILFAVPVIQSITYLKKNNNPTCFLKKIHNCETSVTR